MDIYVDVRAGRDGNGSKEMPFRRINEAAKVAKPGDTVLVAPGVSKNIQQIKIRISNIERKK